MDKENRSFGKIKMYPVVFQSNLVNGAMGLAELSNNSGGVPTTFEKIFGHHGLTCDNSGREHDEIEKEKQQRNVHFCLPENVQRGTHSLGTNSTRGLFSSEKICPPHFCCLSTSS